MIRGAVLSSIPKGVILFDLIFPVNNRGEKGWERA